eukprot:12640405-Ditylum_brightwellii.AAC.1
MTSPESCWRLYQRALQFIEKTEANEDIKKLRQAYDGYLGAKSNDDFMPISEKCIDCRRPDSYK